MPPMLRLADAAHAATRGVDRGDARDREVNPLLEPAEDASEDASETADGGHAGVASNGYHPLGTTEKRTSHTTEERTARKRCRSSKWNVAHNAIRGRTEVYAVQGGAIHSFDRLARKQWMGPKKRTLDQGEMTDAVSRLNGEIARTYFLKHGVPLESMLWVQQSVDVVYIWVKPGTDMGWAVDESPEDDPTSVSGLVVTQVKAPWAWKVKEPAKAGDSERRGVARPPLGKYVVETEAGTSLALPPAKKCLGDMVSDMGRNLKTILEILWQARQIEFAPVGELSELDEVAWLASDCDLSSPRVRRLHPGEKFNVLDLREVHVSEAVKPLLRIRTRDGWVTWGETDDVKKKRGLSIHWRLATAYARSDTTVDPPLYYAGEDAMKDLLPPECRNSSSNIEDPWISIPAIWKKQLGAREGSNDADARVTNWSKRPSAQRDRIAHMVGDRATQEGRDWIRANGDEAEEFHAVVEKASSALAQVHFFKSVPTKYLDVLAAETAIGIERYKKGETVVKYDGGQSFACAALLRDAERPMHHLRTAIQIDVPETVSREQLDEWVKEATRMREQQKADWKLPGAFDGPTETAQLSSPSSILDVAHAATLQDKQSKLQSKFGAVGNAVATSLKRLQSYLNPTGQSDKQPPDFYLCDLFAENTSTGRCKLFSTLLVRMHWNPNTKAAAKRLDIKSMRTKLKHWTPEKQWFASDILAESSTTTRGQVREWALRLINNKNLDLDADEVLGMVTYFFKKILGNEQPDPAALDSLTGEQIDWLLFFKDEDQLYDFVQGKHSATEKVRTPAALQAALQKELLKISNREPEPEQPPEKAPEARTTARAWLEALGYLTKEQIKEAVAYAQEEGEPKALTEMDDDDFEEMIEEMKLGDNEEKFRAAVTEIDEEMKLGDNEEKFRAAVTEIDETPIEFHLCYVQPLCVADADASSYGHKQLQKKLYIVHKGSCNIHKTNEPDKYHKHRTRDDVLHLVEEGGFFGEMQLLHECDLHGYATAIEDLEVWTIDEDLFTTFRGMTMKLLRTVAKRFYRCQQLSDESTAHLIPQNGKPFYLDQDQAKECTALVKLDDVDNRSYVPIHLVATNCPFGVEELRVFLEEGVQLRSLIMSNPWEGEDTTSMVAEHMKIGKLDDLSVLQLGAGPSDRGICELVHTALSRRLIRKDGAAVMKLFNILTVPVASERQHERSTVARRSLLELITAETPMTGERKIELHKFVDYPLDLALCFGKFAMKLAVEQPNEGYEEMVTLFEQMACSILDECNTEDEVELILRQSSDHRREHCRRLLQGSRDLMEYSLKLPAMQQFVSNRNYAAYAEDLWCKHQVIEVEGLKESAHTRRWRADVEDLVRPMVASISSSEMFLNFCVEAVVVIAGVYFTDIEQTLASNPHASLFVCIAMLLVAAIPGSTRWAVWIGGLPLWFTILQIGRFLLFWFPHQSSKKRGSKRGNHAERSCIDTCCNVFKQIFVQLHAMWRVPVVTCGTWLFFHMLAILTTTYVVVEDTNRMLQSFLLLEYVMYTQALGIICSEFFQLYQTIHEVEFRDAGRSLEGVPYFKFRWVHKMVEPGNTLEQFYAVVAWGTCFVWWPLLRVSFGTLNGLKDLHRWCEDGKSRPRHFHARLQLKFPSEDVRAIREEIESYGEEIKSRNSLHEHSAVQHCKCKSFKMVCDTLESFLNEKQREQGTETKISEIKKPKTVATTPCCTSMCLTEQSDYKNTEIHTLMDIMFQFQLDILPTIHHVGTHKIAKPKPADLDARKLHLDMPSSQAALDSLVHSEKRLLAAADPHNLPQLNARQHCNSYQLVEVGIEDTSTRTVALVCDALDGLYQHSVHVMTTYFLDVWQCIDSCLVLVWILNFISRLAMLSYTTPLCFKTSCLEESEANALFVWSRMWAASLAAIMVFMWLRALHFFMLDSSLGPMVLMVIGIVVKDVVLFGQLFVVFLLAFGTAFVSTYRFDPDMFSTFPVALGFTFESAFGQADFSGDTLNSGSYYAVARVMFWSWFILVNVVLLNILIAMMTSTYEQIKANVRSEWRVQRTRFIHEVASSIKNVGNVPPLVLVALVVDIIVWVSEHFLALVFGDTTPDDQYDDTDDIMKAIDKGTDEGAEGKLFRANSASLLHFIENYDDPVRMWGVQPHIRNKHTTTYHNPLNKKELEDWVKELDIDFAGSGAAEFPTFYDHAEARTPQLALHQRWRDLIYTRARFDDGKKDPGVRRDIKKIDDTTSKIQKNCEMSKANTDASLGQKVTAIERKLDDSIASTQRQMDQILDQQEKILHLLAPQSPKLPPEPEPGLEPGLEPGPGLEPEPEPESKPEPEPETTKAGTARAWLEALGYLTKEQIKEAVAYAQEEGEPKALTEMDDDDFEEMIEEMKLGDNEEKFRAAVTEIDETPRL